MQPNTSSVYPLSRKKFLKKSFVTILTFIIILSCIIVLPALFRFAFHSNFSDVVSSSANSVASVGMIIAAIIAALVVVLEVSYQYWYFKSYYYNLGEDVIVIRKNPITPSEVSLPYDKLHDVYLDQDFLDRILKIYDLHISSATAMSGAAAHIDGLDLDNATKLKELILSRMTE